MKRIVTLDVIRGSCIIVMVAVHVFAAIFDKSWVGTDEMSSKTLLDILFLLFVAYLGGMTGLFLMVSTIAHTITIREQLKEGRNLTEVMVRQLISGIMLLVFAFLVESTIGYHGFMGRMANYDPFGTQDFVSVLSNNLERIYYRGFHFMTLHTIAWSIIINTFVQWCLYKRSGISKLRRDTRIYVVLIVAVILLTPFAWKFAGMVVHGYPFETYPGSDRMVQYPLEGTSSPLDLLVLFFLGPLAGQTEPLFPFLFIAFIGAIIGMHLSRDRLPQDLCKKGISMGAYLILVGFFGLQLMWYLGLDSWTNLSRNAFSIQLLGAWMPMMLLTLGGQLVIVFLMLRLVEFRGITKGFAKWTKMIRMFGAVSLTIYTFHYLDALPRFLLDFVPGVDVFGSRDGLITTLMVMFIILIMWGLLLHYWAKIYFVLSVEWGFSKVLGAISRLMSHGPHKGTRDKERWYHVPKLDLFSRKEKVQWIEFVRDEPKGRRGRRDIGLSLALSIAGLFFLPFAVISYFISRDRMKKGWGDRRSRYALLLSKIGILVGVIKLLILSIAQNVVI